jgi:hypothetical protein
MVKLILCGLFFYIISIGIGIDIGIVNYKYMYFNNGLLSIIPMVWNINGNNK